MLTGPEVRDALGSFFVERPWRGESRDRVLSLWAWRREVRTLFKSDTRPGVEETRSAARYLGEGRATNLILPEIEERCIESIRVSGSEFSLLRQQWTALADEKRLLACENETALRESTLRLVGSLAILAASCAGIKGKWRRTGITDCARAHFLSKKLLTIREDAAEGSACFPCSDMEHFSVSLSDLADGINGSGTKKLLWKQTVRIRDALAGTLPLIQDLDRGQAAYMKRWWFVLLEVIRMLERSDFDIPATDTTFGLSSRAQISFQSRFGKTTFRRNLGA